MNVFCDAARAEVLHLQPHADAPWARGALSICEMYRGVEPARFVEILAQMARGADRSALAEGARWLLDRWH